jgi:hypothetical protein
MGAGLLRSHRFKGLLMVAPVVVEVAHHEFLRLNGVHHADRDEPLRMGIREVAKEDPVDDAEDRCRRSDAQHQRNNQSECKNRIAADAADGVADILKKSFHLNTENDPASCPMSTGINRAGTLLYPVPEPIAGSLRNFLLLIRIPHV